jgi:hypothetical protein
MEGSGQGGILVTCIEVCIKIFMLVLAICFCLFFVVIAIGAIVIFVPIYLLFGKDAFKGLGEPC